MKGTRGLVAGLVLAGLTATMLGGCGTLTSRTQAVATDSAERQLVRDANTSMSVTIDFTSSTQEAKRGDSTIDGHRLADAMKKAELSPLPSDAEVYIATVISPDVGEDLQPDPTKPSVIRPMFDHELVWVLRYHHIRMVSFGPPETPAPGVEYGDYVVFVKPAGRTYAVTVPLAR